MFSPEEGHHIDEQEDEDDALPELIALNVRVDEENRVGNWVNVDALQHAERVFG